MIGDFKHRINQVINQYEAQFSDDKPMSPERAYDIIDIKGLLNQAYHHPDDCTQVLKQRLQEFKTGWWIFSTGNSRLRDAIYSVMVDYSNPSMRMVFSKLQTLEDQSISFEERRQLTASQYENTSGQLTNSMDNTSAESTLYQQLQEKDVLIKHLQSEVKRLQLALKQSQNIRQQQVILLTELRNQRESESLYTTPTTREISATNEAHQTPSPMRITQGV
jgi:hypothetical protein